MIKDTVMESEHQEWRELEEQGNCLIFPGVCPCYGNANDIALEGLLPRGRFLKVPGTIRWK